MYRWFFYYRPLAVCVNVTFFGVVFHADAAAVMVCVCDDRRSSTPPPPPPPPKSKYQMDHKQYTIPTTSTIFLEESTDIQS